MDINRVVECLCRVLEENKKKIEMIYQFSGGWEIWLQCEMACRFNVGEVLREVPLWNDKRACDLVFSNGYAVELKCPGWLRVQSSKKYGGMTFGSTKGGIKKLAGEIEKDKLKIQEYRHNSIGKHGCSIVVLAGEHAFEQLGTYLTTKCQYRLLLDWCGFHIIGWQG